jgi:hypothetical protein
VRSRRAPATVRLEAAGADGVGPDGEPSAVCGAKERHHRVPDGILVWTADRVLEVEHDHIRTAIPRLGEAFRAVSRDEQQRPRQPQEGGIHCRPPGGGNRGSTRMSCSERMASRNVASVSRTCVNPDCLTLTVLTRASGGGSVSPKPKV